MVMESFSSSGSTVPSIEDYLSHSVWNLLLKLLVHEQRGSAFVLFVVEVELAKIALSCHFAFDLLCYREGAYASA